MRASYKGISINTSKNTHETVFGLINKNKDHIVADIPSGNGAFTKRLKDYGFRRILAIDIENILQFGHEDFNVGNMNEKLNFSDNSIDTLVCIDGIEHIKRQVDFVAEVNRVLKKNGDFILSTPNISSLRSRWKWLMTGHHHKCSSPLDENHPSSLHHIGMISFPEIRYMLHTNGFKITQVNTNRIKFISWLFIVLVPFIFLATLLSYHNTGKKNNTIQINKQVRKVMFSKAILFGETLIVKAKKISQK